MQPTAMFMVWLILARTSGVSMLVSGVIVTVIPVAVAGTVVVMMTTRDPVRMLGFVIEDAAADSVLDTIVNQTLVCTLEHVFWM